MINKINTNRYYESSGEWSAMIEKKINQIIDAINDIKKQQEENTKKCKHEFENIVGFTTCRKCGYVVDDY